PGEKKVGELLARLPLYVYDDCSVREAADHMVNHGIGRLPVVSRENPKLLVGILTRSDIMSVFRMRASEGNPQAPNLHWALPSRLHPPSNGAKKAEPVPPAKPAEEATATPPRERP